MKYFSFLAATGFFFIFLYGCAEIAPAERDIQREFTFDFSIPGKKKNELWKSARDFFAESFSDSRSVTRVSDENDGTIIGRALAPWNLAANVCYSEFHIRFAAKDERARLQFELIEAAVPVTGCGYDWPTRNGYDQIVSLFNSTAVNLKSALSGKGSTDKLKDF